MSKGKNETPVIDVSIELKENGSVLLIPYRENTQAALRIFNGSEQIFYGSSRLGNLQKKEPGYEVDVTGSENLFAGKTFELKDVASRKVVLTGRIIAKQAESARVIELDKSVKTGTGK